nr:hypothetical protein [Tanacetum cinerariifolium]
MEVKRRTVKVKELQERWIIKAFQVIKSRKDISSTQGKVSNIPMVLSWGGGISPDSFLPSFLLLVVIIATVVIVAVIVIVVVVGEGWANEFHQDRASSIEPDLGELTSIVELRIRKNVLSTTNVNLSPEDDRSPLFAYVVWIFLPFLTYAV